MKKFISISFILLLVFAISMFLSNAESVFPASATTEIRYARIINSNAGFYEVPSDITKPPLFILPETYFVLVLEDYNDTFIKVKYLDLEGYAKKTDLIGVEENPNPAFLENITFSIKKDNTPLMSEPLTSSTVKQNLTDKSLTFQYIGKITGDTPEGSIGNVWYYTKVSIDGNDIYGYIHDSYTENITPYSSNEIIVTEISLISIIGEQSLTYLDLTLDNIIILLLTLPALVTILYLAFSSRKKNLK